MNASGRNGSARASAWGIFPLDARSFFTDVPVLLAAASLFYVLLATGHYWRAPVNAHPDISFTASALPRYALLSVLRIAIAYVFSLVFAVAYAYAAASSRALERLLIPLLDTLQSIPVLSFLPGVMVSMMALFPGRQLGLEMGSILLIFSGQVWNMAFSFYSSLKSIPAEMREAAQIYRWSWWQRLIEMELPYGAIGLVWNSMMSVAGGWFFLIACEMFVLGDRDYRLPGLGSYLQLAANAGDMRALLAGLAVMIGVIVLMDQLIWRPVIAWAEKFKFEQVESSQAPRSAVLDWLRRSRVLPLVEHATVEPAMEWLTLRFARRSSTEAPGETASATRGKAALLWALAAVALAAIAYACVKMCILVAGVSRAEWRMLFVGGGATFLRVEVTLLLAALWTIPAGVAIGLNAKLAAFFQPLAQIAASVPATALFPVILLMLIRAGGGMSLGAILLMLLGTQWYVLFNVIAGAIALPTDLKEVCGIFDFGSWERWRTLLLPGIFPYLITALVTASGGAWNASIVAEYVHFQGRVLQTTGLGAAISQATDDGNFRVLLAATLLMAGMVVTINRLLWRRLYRLAETRFKLET